jgi:hypothetical protein
MFECCQGHDIYLFFKAFKLALASTQRLQLFFSKVKEAGV